MADALDSKARSTPYQINDLWRGLLECLVAHETGGTYNPLVMANGGDVNNRVWGENSYGLLQFNSARACGQSFRGGLDQFAVPIYRTYAIDPATDPNRDGLVADWKILIRQCRTPDELAGVVQRLQDYDWRADPLSTFINGIGSWQNYYAWMIWTDYDEDVDIRVDVRTPPPGQSGQATVFELLGAAHHQAGDAFGDHGGLIRGEGGTPDSWDRNRIPAGGAWDYAAYVGNWYNTHAPAGGYPYEPGE